VDISQNGGAFQTWFQELQKQPPVRAMVVHDSTSIVKNYNGWSGLRVFLKKPILLGVFDLGISVGMIRSDYFSDYISWEELTREEFSAADMYKDSIRYRLDDLDRQFSELSGNPHVDPDLLKEILKSKDALLAQFTIAENRANVLERRMDDSSSYSIQEDELKTESAPMYPMNKAASLFNLIALYRYALSYQIHCNGTDHMRYRNSSGSDGCFYSFSDVTVPIAQIDVAIIADVRFALKKFFPELTIQNPQLDSTTLRQLDLILDTMRPYLSFKSDFSYESPDTLTALRTTRYKLDGQLYSWYSLTAFSSQFRYYGFKPDSSH
jgi:hypothetical protein